MGRFGVTRPTHRLSQPPVYPVCLRNAQNTSNCPHFRTLYDVRVLARIYMHQSLADRFACVVQQMCLTCFLYGFLQQHEKSSILTDILHEPSPRVTMRYFPLQRSLHIRPGLYTRDDDGVRVRTGRKKRRWKSRWPTSARKLSLLLRKRGTQLRRVLLTLFMSDDSVLTTLSDNVQITEGRRRRRLRRKLVL